MCEKEEVCVRKRGYVFEKEWGMCEKEGICVRKRGYVFEKDGVFEKEGYV